MGLELDCLMYSGDGGRQEGASFHKCKWGRKDEKGFIYSVHLSAALRRPFPEK